MKKIKYGLIVASLLLSCNTYAIVNIIGTSIENTVSGVSDSAAKTVSSTLGTILPNTIADLINAISAIPVAILKKSV